jgi:hypothetical protein
MTSSWWPESFPDLQPGDRVKLLTRYGHISKASSVAYHVGKIVKREKDKWHIEWDWQDAHTGAGSGPLEGTVPITHPKGELPTNYSYPLPPGTPLEGGFVYGLLICPGCEQKRLNPTLDDYICKECRG